MPSRAADWLRQAERDLQHARDAMERRTFEWAAFAAQQAAEKAVKAMYQHLGADAYGHSVALLLSKLSVSAAPSNEIVDVARELDKHYIAPRYPNSYPEGAPMDFYTEAEARRAIDGAERIVGHCKDHVLR